MKALHEIKLALLLGFACAALSGCALPGIDNHRGIFSQPWPASSHTKHTQ